jgi:hypothetical protein
MRKNVLFATIFVLILGACSAGTTDVPSTPPSSSSTSIAQTQPAALGFDMPAIETAIDDWFKAIRAGEIAAAWDLMSPRSQRSLGSYEMLVSISTELEEGWAEWAVAEERTLTITGATADDPVTILEVELSGIVTREGMTEEAQSVMRVVQDEDRYLVSPFEEFGNVARQVNADPADLDRPPVPEGSGQGRRVVYANEAQRVWLIDETENVVDTYLVSGKQGVPAPGTYEIYSKSELAYAGHDNITMRYMARFTQSPTSDLAIGFHSIPYFGNGEPLQSEEQLGEYHSAGCVRQSLGHAAALYEWAPEGTVVVVLP